MSLTASALAAMAILAPAQEYARPQDGPQRGAPRGSYAQTCTGSYVNQGRLYADCRDTRGRIRSTSIELARCSSSDIANDDGLLVCQGVRGSYENNGGGNNGGGWGGGNNGGGWGGGNNGGGWGGGNNGGGRNSITIYQDANFRGYSETLRGPIYDLARSGFNDRISSMQMNGSWEACTDANFRGQCQVFTGSVRNLARWGMNDRISSLRPVRGGGRW
ncbi:hypothetical protein IP78_09470 [Brevundimonas sp. AAP58]|uniref:beta/gamma crystallin-related protein n=1 Tax=Brevundimonas sp. AAP58 TaxID=1523422 RepID=UPI0006B90156|nr:beta/gamma crystallin-related protein [Brevundimonas sp. AAP58]KPF79269.1 hypothetical protein IP78_09470 [Brevundimonas sp. AAP58]